MVPCDREGFASQRVATALAQRVAWHQPWRHCAPMDGPRVGPIALNYGRAGPVWADRLRRRRDRMWLHLERRDVCFQEFNFRWKNRERAAAGFLLDRLSLMAGLQIAASSKCYIARGRCDMPGANVPCLAPWNADVWS